MQYLTRHAWGNGSSNIIKIINRGEERSNVIEGEKTEGGGDMKGKSMNLMLGILVLHCLISASEI